MNLYLNRRTVQTLRILIDGYLEVNDEFTEAEIYELKELSKEFTNVDKRHTFQIKSSIIIIPETSDIVINVLSLTILDLIDNDIDTTEVENAFWEYLGERYGFDLEAHYLSKHTTEEAITYAINHLNLGIK